MLIDEAEIILKAGHGGAGKVSFVKRRGGGPDGGNGGKGGNIYIKVTTDLIALRPFTFKKTISAPNGEPGGSNKRFGKDGADLEIELPVGSVLMQDAKTPSMELNIPNQKILICKGGKGGKGNFELKSPRLTTPVFAQPGLEGEEKHFKVILKLIADFGIIGLPNSGKSSLLNELTQANVKTAGYPFTTLEPNLAVLSPHRADPLSSEEGSILADIPGLIEGASEGKGLGIKFLKHIEKTKVLLHCISIESADLLKDYNTVKKELSNFNPELTSKNEIIIITKCDLADKNVLDRAIKKLKNTAKEIIPVSIYDWDSLEALKKKLTAI